MLKPITPLVASLMLTKMLLSKMYHNSKSPQFTLSGTLCLTLPTAPIVYPSCNSLNRLLTASVPILSTTTVARKCPVVSPSSPSCHSTTVKLLHVQAISSKARTRNRGMQLCSKAIDLVNHPSAAAIKTLLERVIVGGKAKQP